MFAYIRCVRVYVCSSSTHRVIRVRTVCRTSTYRVSFEFFLFGGLGLFEPLLLLLVVHQLLNAILVLLKRRLFLQTWRSMLINVAHDLCQTTSEFVTTLRWHDTLKSAAYFNRDHTILPHIFVYVINSNNSFHHCQKCLKTPMLKVSQLAISYYFDTLKAHI